MPKVGGKHFSYSSKGKKAAKAYAKKTGQSVGKYEGGGSVDPFSTRNPEGVPATQLKEMLETQNMVNEGLPTANAQERSQAMPDTEQYNKGGKVDVRDVVKEAEKGKRRSKPLISGREEKAWDILNEYNPTGASSYAKAKQATRKSKIKGMTRDILKKKKKGKKK